MDKNGFVSKIHHKKPPHREMPARIRRVNAGKSVIRSRVEHVFAEQKPRMGLFIRRRHQARGDEDRPCILAHNIGRFNLLERISAT